jgi:hypothetical protein
LPIGTSLEMDYNCNSRHGRIRIRIEMLIIYLSLQGG